MSSASGRSPEFCLDNRNFRLNRHGMRRAALRYIPRMLKTRRALVSVYDKRGLEDLARGLDRLGIEIVSTGGTLKFLQEKGIPVTGVSDVTGFPEILDG